MNLLEQYKDKKVAIHVDTEEKAKQVVKWIVELGGRDFKEWGSWYKTYKSNTCLSMINIGIHANTYCSKVWYKKEGYRVINYDALVITVDNYEMI